MRRALALLALTLAVFGLPTAVLGQAEGPTVTKAPKLVKFVAAVYPKDKHDAGITASVELSIEIGDDGIVGDVTVVKSAATPDFDYFLRHVEACRAQ